MPYAVREIDRTERVWVLLLSVLFMFPALDASRVPYTAPSLWVAFYIPAVCAAAWYAITRQLTALQLLVVFGAVPGVARAVLYLIGPEHRLAPVGLNGAIAVLLALYHRVRRLDAL